MAYGWVYGMQTVRGVAMGFERGKGRNLRKGDLAGWVIGWGWEVGLKAGKVYAMDAWTAYEWAYGMRRGEGTAFARAEGWVIECWMRFGLSVL